MAPGPIPTEGAKQTKSAAPQDGGDLRRNQSGDSSTEGLALRPKQSTDSSQAARSPELRPSARSQHHASAGKVSGPLMPHHLLSPHLRPSSMKSSTSQSDPADGEELVRTHPLHHRHQSHRPPLFAQVAGWLQQEMSKVHTIERQQRAARASTGHDQPLDDGKAPEGCSEGSSILDFKSSLERLGKILDDYIVAEKNGTSLRHKRSLSAARRKGLRKGSGSDTEVDDQHVPAADVVLDNTKTLSYSGGEANNEGVHAKDWDNFKTAIMRLTHTLRLKGWRRLPLDAAPEIEVVRLSGALTNAVYVVSPPKNLREITPEGLQPPKRPPPKLLLRVYGPQVEHLIDREKELGILHRLGKQNIGPRLLGTFKNGRFEQFYEARPLTAKELRMPNMSKHIAKRMRELHDGIELLREERQAGPNVWHNWDKWLDRLGQVATWLDQQILSPENEVKKAREPWRRRGFVFGAPWEQFVTAFERYRKWVHSCFENEDEVRARLVFAHNDTQYGNILKMEPTNQSPLLMPANEHRQLVVIDFEYASANMRGLEFANHFTEWCYDYHDEHESWKCNLSKYPKPEEQERFIKAYLTHRPYQADHTPSAPSARATPMTLPIHPSRSPRIPPLVLDDHNEVDLSKLTNTDTVEADVLKLMGETRMWRPANSAQWSAWGIVQAKVPGLEEALDGPKKNENPEDSQEGDKESTTGDQSEEQEEGEEFDYLAYAQDRACFFWADLLALGIVQENELESDMLKHIKERIIEF